ncbi:MAG: protein kinase, partial [Verrucomicrobia bacterium]|nr:protein kinase [Verrucomicrobiota bacterium]
MAEGPSAEAIFAGALELAAAEERSLYLDQACAGRPAIRTEVDSLLAAHNEARDFLSGTHGLLSVSTKPTANAGSVPRPVIAGFQVSRALGSGGLGTVYEAWDEKLQRKVALKILHAASDPATGRRMLDEARKTAALRHPSIVTVHAVLDEHQPPAIVMELVEGFPIDHFAG